MQKGVVKDGFKDRVSHLRWINNCFVTLSSKGQCQFCKSTTTIYNEGSRAKDHLKKTISVWVSCFGSSQNSVRNLLGRHILVRMKQLHDLTLNRSSSKEAFGFRIIGGKDLGQTFKVRFKYWLNYWHTSSNKGTSSFTSHTLLM